MVFQARDILVERKVRDTFNQRSRSDCGGLKGAAGYVALCFAIVALHSASAQEQNPDFVDAFAPVDASAADFHSAKFQEAERALLEGLTRQESPTPSKHPPTNGAQPHRGSQTASRNMPDASEAPPAVRRAPIVQNDPDVSDMDSTVPVMPVVLNNNSRAESKAVPKPAPKVEPVSTDAPVRETQAPPSKAKTPPQPAKPVVSSAQNRTAVNEAEMQELRRELADTKSQLAAAEMEISRLSTIIQEASRARLAMKDSPTSVSVASPKSAPRPATSKQAVAPPSVAALDRTPSEVADPVSDLQVATISVDKADLRLGPGRNHSALMSLRKGSRLAVEARQGEWYRVFAPNGQRAWIHSSLVRFGDGAASLNDGSSVRVRGYDAKMQ